MEWFASDNITFVHGLYGTERNIGKPLTNELLTVNWKNKLIKQESKNQGIGATLLYFIVHTI